MPCRRSSRIVRAAFSALVLVLPLGFSSCVWHEHTVGLGPSGIGQESGRQFYLFFGLLRLNEVDSQRLTHDMRGYRITTEFAFTDLILAPLFLPLTVTTRTVTVER